MTSVSKNSSIRKFAGLAIFPQSFGEKNQTKYIFMFMAKCLVNNAEDFAEIADLKGC